MTPQELNLQKALYSIGDVMKVLSLGRNSVYRLMQSGELPPVKYGKRTLIAAPDLANFVTKCRANTAGADSSFA